LADWKPNFLAEAEDDLNSLNGTARKQVVKAITKVAQNPLPQSEGGYGKPLGNKNGNNLTGCNKIKLLDLGLRVVYKLVRAENKMTVIVISARADNKVYEEAEKRIKKYGL
jgi:mRNA interferase RelE/StbE